MRRMLVFVAMLAAGCTSQPVEMTADAVVPAGALGGRWTVDLSTNPGEPYTKTMELNLAADGSVTGSFYDSEILAGRWKTDRVRTCVSFRTTDGAGPYQSTRFLEIPCVYKTWPAIRSVGFGPKCSSADEERIRNRFAHLKDVEFWRSDLPIR